MLTHGCHVASGRLVFDLPSLREILSDIERRRLTNGFSERLAVYYALAHGVDAHDFRGLRDAGVALLKQVSAEEKRQGRKPRDRFDVVVGVVVDRLAQRASESAARAAAATPA